MIEEDAFERKLTRHLDTGEGNFIVVIKKSRWSLSTAELITEKITSKEKATLALEKSAVPDGVPGETDHLKPTPLREQIPALEPMIDLR